MTTGPRESPATAGAAASRDPGEEIVLRPLRRSDLGRVDTLEPLLFEEEAWSRETYEDELAHPSRRYVAAILRRPAAGERLIGWAGVSLGGDAEVMTIGVDPAHRRRGIARRLLRAMIADAAEAGGERLLLEVREANCGARALYESEGFTAIAVRRGYYRSTGEDAVVMERALGLGDGPDHAPDRAPDTRDGSRT